MKPIMRLICLGALALAGCQNEKKTPVGGTAQGEILPGSASDAMLPLDTVRSQPPLAPVEVASGKPGQSQGARRSKSEAGEPGQAQTAAEPSGAAPRIEADTSVTQ